MPNSSGVASGSTATPAAKDRRRVRLLRWAVLLVVVFLFYIGVYLGPEWVSVISQARRIHVPVLLISGNSDWIVPSVQVREVQAALASERKPLLAIPGAQHDTTFSASPALYSNPFGFPRFPSRQSAISLCQLTTYG